MSQSQVLTPMPVKVGRVLTYAPLNFAVLLSMRNSQNKGHAKMYTQTAAQYCRLLK